MALYATPGKDWRGLVRACQVSGRSLGWFVRVAATRVQLNLSRYTGNPFSLFPSSFFWLPAFLYRRAVLSTSTLAGRAPSAASRDPDRLPVRRCPPRLTKLSLLKATVFNVLDKLPPSYTAPPFHHIVAFIITRPSLITADDSAFLTTVRHGFKLGLGSPRPDSQYAIPNLTSALGPES
jgi:hypothetical protein